jgi:hypothetical protein
MFKNKGLGGVLVGPAGLRVLIKNNHLRRRLPQKPLLKTLEEFLER